MISVNRLEHLRSIWQSLKQLRLNKKILRLVCVLNMSGHARILMLPFKRQWERKMSKSRNFIASSPKLCKSEPKMSLHDWNRTSYLTNLTCSTTIQHSWVKICKVCLQTTLASIRHWPQLLTRTTNHLTLWGKISQIPLLSTMIYVLIFVALRLMSTPWG